MQQSLIFYPAVAMFLLTASVLMKTGVARYRASSQGAVDPRYYKLYRGDGEPDNLRQLSRHLQNHFEVPPLFHIVLILHFVSDAVSMLSLILAWAFVAFRLAHSLVHLGSNKVVHRFSLFIGSVAVLIGLWMHFLAQLMQQSAST